WSTSKTPSYTKSVSWQHHLTTETALLSCIKQAREDVLTLRHLQLLHQNR
ncbi:hypothetical protein, partial [Escherichia coli]